MNSPMPDDTAANPPLGAICEICELLEELREKDKEIGRLREAMKKIADTFGYSDDTMDNLREIARAALSAGEGAKT